MEKPPAVGRESESDEEAPADEVESSAGTVPDAENVAGSGEIEPEQLENEDTASEAKMPAQSDEKGATSEVAEANPAMYITIHVPHYDDGLDDDDDEGTDADLRLYGGMYSD